MLPPFISWWLRGRSATGLPRPTWGARAVWFRKDGTYEGNKEERNFLEKGGDAPLDCFSSGHSASIYQEPETGKLRSYFPAILQYLLREREARGSSNDKPQSTRCISASEIWLFLREGYLPSKSQQIFDTSFVDQKLSNWWIWIHLFQD